MNSIKPMMTTLPHKSIFGFQSNLNAARWNSSTSSRNAICRTKKPATRKSMKFALKTYHCLAYILNEYEFVVALAFDDQSDVVEHEEDDGEVEKAFAVQAAVLIHH